MIIKSSPDTLMGSRDCDDWRPFISMLMWGHCGLCLNGNYWELQKDKIHMNKRLILTSLFTVLILYCAYFTSTGETAIPQKWHCHLSGTPEILSEVGNLVVAICKAEPLKTSVYPVETKHYVIGCLSFFIFLVPEIKAFTSLHLFNH